MTAKYTSSKATNPFSTVLPQRPVALRTPPGAAIAESTARPRANPGAGATPAGGAIPAAGAP